MNIFVKMAFPVFHEFNADGTIRTNGLHLEGFQRLAWEALSAAGYTTPPTYEVSEFERLGVPRCRVIVIVLPHPDLLDRMDRMDHLRELLLLAEPLVSLRRWLVVLTSPSHFRDCITTPH
jgi:hypothetical protein